MLQRLGLAGPIHGVYAAGWQEATGDELTSVNPANGETIGTLTMATSGEYDAVAANAVDVFQEWRMLPAPKRGDYVRQIGNALRDVKTELGALVSLESGKILAEGEGEVQEMIDIADFAVGLSRQLYGLTMVSERSRHRMYEQWHPFGPCGIISAFNFPVAVWSWNALIAAVCGDTNIWKPSLRTPLSAVAVTQICHDVMAGSGFEGVFNLAIGTDEQVGHSLVNDERVPLISATGSCNMGRIVGPAVL
ncbi:MAG: aldehyde dehydrogenase family protein, partial [Acidimicrobiia bacterium]|nr:aldehyde dehydrogenase family protein [Acidimicrobiia bacterium]